MNKDFFLHLKRAYLAPKFFPNFLGIGKNNVNPVLKLSDGYVEMRAVFRVKRVLLSEIAEIKIGTFKNYVVIVPQRGIFKYIFVMDSEQAAQEVIQTLK